MYTFSKWGGREFVLVGTAHISRESAALVREVIDDLGDEEELEYRK